MADALVRWACARLPNDKEAPPVGMGGASLSGDAGQGRWPSLLTTVGCTAMAVRS